MTTQGDEDSPPPSQDSLACSLEGVPQGRFKLSDDESGDEDHESQAPKRLMSAADLVEAKRRKFVSYPRSGLKDGALVEAPGEKEDDSPPLELDDLIK